MHLKIKLLHSGMLSQKNVEAYRIVTLDRHGQQLPHKSFLASVAGCNILLLHILYNYYVFIFLFLTTDVAGRAWTWKLKIEIDIKFSLYLLLLELTASIFYY